MFYKIRNILVVVISCLVAFATHEAKAQGLVSLSEEAMFDDELESNRDFPSLEVPSEPKTEEVPAAPTVMPKGPAAAKAPVVMPKGPAAELPAPKIEAKAVPAPAENKTNVFAAPVVASAPNPATDEKSSNDDFATVKGDLFSQMSDIEKRTALLNLELRREKLQNEIEAVKAQRRQALVAEEEKAEALRLKNIEFEKEQERKVLVEQEKLRELDIAFETLRQEKLLGAYKNKMLEEHQKWIGHNAVFYDQIANLRASKKKLVEDLKVRVEELKKEAQKANELYNSKVENYKKENKDLQAQLGVLRKRIETVERERDELSANPFASGIAPDVSGSSVSTTSTTDEVAGGVVAEPVETNLSKLYAVTEIRGQGGEMVAKLINKNGTAFYVKKGTALQSGHVVGEISSTYVTAEKGGEKTYLYFAAGGILPAETSNFEIDSSANNSSK